MPINHVITGRMSWSADSSTLAFVDTAQLKAYTIKVVGKSSFPFDTKEVPLFYDGQCMAIEYMPGSNDKLIAVYRDWVKREDPAAWKIIEFTLVEGYPVMTRELADNLEAPLKMHIVPDGKSIMLAYPSGCWTVNYDNMKIGKIDWITNGAKIADDVVIDMTSFDWSVNDDMKIIAFSAKSILEPGRSNIYVANITGTNVKNFTPNKLEDVMMRYMPKGFAVVPKSSISTRLAERMRYIPEIKWNDDEKMDVKMDDKPVK